MHELATVTAKHRRLSENSYLMPFVKSSSTEMRQTGHSAKSKKQKAKQEHGNAFLLYMSAELLASVSMQYK